METAESIPTGKTIFCSGFPHDVKYREVSNMFRFIPGYQYCVLNLKGKFPTAFANFEDEESAINAIEKLQGILYDEENYPNFQMRAEMAKTNIRKPHTRTIRKRHGPPLDRPKGFRSESFEPGRKRMRGMYDNGPPMGPLGPPYGNPMSYGPPHEPFPAPLPPRNDPFMSRSSGYNQDPFTRPIGNSPPEPRFGRGSREPRHRRGPPDPHYRGGHDMRYRNGPPPRHGKSHGTGAGITTLFIANMGTYTTEEEVNDLFGRQPGFRRLKFTPAKGAKPPVAFVNFIDHHFALRTLQALQGATLRSSEHSGIKIEFAKKNMGEASSRHGRGDRNDRGNRDDRNIREVLGGPGLHGVQDDLPPEPEPLQPLTNLSPSSYDQLHYDNIPFAE